MNSDIERDLGEQPLAKIMAAQGLKPHDLVNSSSEQLTHKMVARAVKGRRLKPHSKFKVLNAINKACGKDYSLKDIFDY